jgi:hypothetical protein
MFAKIVGTTTYYYIRDALGSTRQVWQHGQIGATFSVATYKPFGKPVNPSGTEKFEYVGELIVAAAGTPPELYYIEARWMDPELDSHCIHRRNHPSRGCCQDQDSGDQLDVTATSTNVPSLGSEVKCSVAAKVRPIPIIGVVTKIAPSFG